MRRVFIKSILLCLTMVSCNALGQGMYSPYNAKALFDLAHEIYSWPGAGERQRAQAMVMLNAVYEMDSRAEYVFPEIIDLADKSYEVSYEDAVLLALRKYLRADSDLMPAIKATRYLVNQQDSREQRQAVLTMLTRQVAARNKVYYSQIATELGLLYAEKADNENAEKMFSQAYAKNPYNDLAFSKLLVLAGDKISDDQKAVHYRFMLANNPLDLDMAMGFASYAYKMGLYNEAFTAWKYCADLFSYLNGPSSVLPADIYLPLTLSGLKCQGGLSDVLQIAAAVRQEHEFDIVLEAIAAEAADKMGDNKLREKILTEAEEKALALNKEGKLDDVLLAWFYCFAKVDSQGALAWANKAYTDRPESEDVLAVFGYAMVLNEEYDLAAGYFKDINDNQIALLGKAEIALAKGDSSLAIEDLKKAIAVDAGSIEADRAVAVLNEQGSAYLPAEEPGAIRLRWQKKFGNQIIGKFSKPEDKLKIRIKTDGNEFSYEHNIGVSLIITNLGDDPIVINKNSILKGNFVFDVSIKGDINAKIHDLLKVHRWPSEPIEPDGSIVIPVNIATGPLREILLSYPQAKFDIEITAYIDPVTGGDGSKRNYIASLEPAKAVIRRTPVILTDRYLQSRLRAINKGQQGQILRSVKLFAGLLAEQNAFSRMKKPLYRFLNAEAELLKSALVKALRDGGWTVRFQTMLTMQFVPLEYELSSALTERIQDEKWPIRMMALALLANSQGFDFQKVLNWSADNDSNELVRRMAVALGGKVSKDRK